MIDNSVVESIKKDIEELLEAKKELIKLGKESLNIPVSDNGILNEINWNLNNAMSQANIDINHIPVRSPRPVIGGAITILKRAVRKSTYWLYQPLFIKLTGFNSIIVNTLNKIVQYIEEIKNQTNDQLIQIFNQQNSKMEEKINVIEQRIASLNNLLIKLGDEIKNKEHVVNEINNLKALVEDNKRETTLIEENQEKILNEVSTIKNSIENSKEEIISYKNNFEELKNDFNTFLNLHNDFKAQIISEHNNLIDINKNLEKVIKDYDNLIKNNRENIIGELTTLKKLVESYRSESSFLRAKLAVLLQHIKNQAKTDNDNYVKLDDSLITSINTDFIYHTFEHYFRGSEDLIKERQRKYIPDIKKAYENCNGYVIDIGSGRGEFLELCREAGIPAKGVDLNEVMIEHCEEKGLEVVKCEGISYLQTIPDATLCAVTAFQVIEHLTQNQIMNLIQTALIKLKPGGILILETVNVDSLFSLKNFYYDLTHIKPIPSTTLCFLLEAVGFRNVSIIYSSPIPDDAKLTGNDDNIKKLNDLLFAEQDYAVKGWR